MLTPSSCLALVSDEPASGSLLVDLLSDLRYPVVSMIPVTAQALSVLRAAQPAAILIDIGGHDGDVILALLDQVQRDGVLASVPILALLCDSSLMAPYKARLTQRGIAVVNKPFVIPLLLNQIEAAVGAMRHVPALNQRTLAHPELLHVLA